MIILVTNALGGRENIDLLLSDFFEQSEIEESRGILFSIVLPKFRSSPRSKRIICLIKGTSTKAHYILAGTRGYPAGSIATQLDVTDAQQLETPIALSSIIKNLEKRHRSHVEKAIQNGAVLPNKSGDEFLKYLRQSHSEISKFIEDISESVVNMSGHSQAAPDALIDHHDAVLTAFKIAEFKSDDFSVAEISEEKQWFLDRVNSPHLREDPAVTWDSERFPNLELADENIHGKQFSSNGKTLTVMLVNRQPLEEVTGNDLIYINETTDSFVGIQYKMWEAGSESEIFRTSSGNFHSEFASMEELAEAMNDIAQGEPTPQNYRLSSESLYFKFCSRVHSDHDQTQLFSGQHFSLGYFKHLRQTDALTGPKGGERILRWDENLNPLQTSEFVSLVKSGMIGSYPTQTAFIKRLIHETLAQGRAVTIASLSETPD